MKNENEPIRIAQIMGKMNSGGVESFVMNYYREIDKTKVQFDFIVDNDSEIPQEKEIIKLGGRIFKISPYQKIFEYIKDLTKILKENNYIIIHSHLNSLSVFPLYCAWKVNIPIRIAHSHSTTNKIEWKKNIFKNILKLFIKVFSTDYCACSEHAARWLFGNKSFEKDEVTIIYNAIDLNRFKYNKERRDFIRKQLNLSDKIIIGNVGRFMLQKNHEFIIDIFNNVLKKEPNSVLILIGEGPLEKKIKEKVKLLELTEHVQFLGTKDNVGDYMQAMDIFIFPSLYEGLGMVVIESQCSGLKTICSTEVPQETNLTDSIMYMDLNISAQKWSEYILENVKYNRKNNLSIIQKSNYDIKIESKKLEKYYLERIENNRKG